MLDQANAEGNKLIEEARAAAARVQEQETQKAIAAAEQVMLIMVKEASVQERARMLAQRSRSSAGCSSRPPPR